MVWTLALTCIGLAIQAVAPAGSSDTEQVGKVRLVSQSDSDLGESEDISAVPAIDLDQFLDADDADQAASMRIANDEADDSGAGAGRARISGRGFEQPQPQQPQPELTFPGTSGPVRGRIRIQDDARVAPPASRRKVSVPPPAPMTRREMRTSRVNPTSQQYPFERAASFAPPTRPVQGIAASPESQIHQLPNQSASQPPGRPAPVLDDESDDDESDDDDVDESNAATHSAVAALLEETADAGEEPPAGVADDCRVTESEVQDFVAKIEQVTKRRPIRELRADMNMRLPAEQSGLIEDIDRNSARETARCRIEHDRALVRQYWRVKFGPGYDRGSGVWYNGNLAPEFPFCYHPLYFEDANLERCGYSLGCCTQPLVSGLQFYANVALLPFKMCQICPCDYVYPQSDCEPCTRYSYCDNLLGPCPERTGWGMFRWRGWRGDCQGR
jgi:hypothetical protein